MHELDKIEQGRKQIVELKNTINRLTKEKDNAYSERNKCVQALSKLFPSSLERHTDEDKTWDDDWRWIVFIQFPTGQATWHIHDSELPLFDHLPKCLGVKWDGHSTEQKYERLAALPEADGFDDLFYGKEEDRAEAEYDPAKDNYENGRRRPECRPGFAEMFAGVEIVKGPVSECHGNPYVPCEKRNA